MVGCIDDAELDAEGEVGEGLAGVVEQPEVAAAMSDDLSLDEGEAVARVGTGADPVGVEGAGGAVEYGAPGCRRHERRRSGQDLVGQECDAAAGERDIGEHRVGGTGPRVQRRPGHVAVGGVVDAAEIVGHACCWIIVHPQRPGFVVGGAELVAAVDVRVERREVHGGGAGGHGDGAPTRGRDDLEWLAVREDQRDFVGEGVHRLPDVTVELGLLAAPGRSS